MAVQIQRAQLGEGAELAVPYVPTEALCAVRALRRYLAAASIESGPLFRVLSPRRELGTTALDGRDVANLVKRLARRARVDGNFTATACARDSRRRPRQRRCHSTRSRARLATSLSPFFSATCGQRRHSMMLR